MVLGGEGGGPGQEEGGPEGHLWQEELEPCVELGKSDFRPHPGNGGGAVLEAQKGSLLQENASSSLALILGR